MDRPGVCWVGLVAALLAAAGCTCNKPVTAFCGSACPTATAELNRLAAAADEAVRTTASCPGFRAQSCAGGGLRLVEGDAFCNTTEDFDAQGRLVWLSTGCEARGTDYGSRRGCDPTKVRDLCDEARARRALMTVTAELWGNVSCAVDGQAIEVKAGWAKFGLSMGPHVLTLQGHRLALDASVSQRRGMRVDAKGIGDGLQPRAGGFPCEGTLCQVEWAVEGVDGGVTLSFSPSYPPSPVERAD